MHPEYISDTIAVASNEIRGGTIETYITPIVADARAIGVIISLATGSTHAHPGNIIGDLGVTNEDVIHTIPITQHNLDVSSVGWAMKPNTAGSDRCRQYVGLARRAWQPNLRARKQYYATL